MARNRSDASILKDLAALEKGLARWRESERIRRARLKAPAGIDEAPSTTPQKTSLTLRLDADIVAWFRGKGRGYQARINAVLRAHMLTCAREGGSAPGVAVAQPQEDDGADRGDHQRADEAGGPEAHEPEQHPPDEGADDAGDEVADEPAAAAPGPAVGDPAGDEADDQEADEADAEH